MVRQKKIEENNLSGTGLVLSIFLAVTLAQGLSFFVGFEDNFSWLATSIVLIGIIITLVYVILDVKSVSWIKETTKVASVGLLSLLPFALQRLTMEVNEQPIWEPKMFMWYFIIFLISLVGWGLSEIFYEPKNKSKGKIILIVTGVILVMLILGIALIKTGLLF